MIDLTGVVIGLGGAAIIQAGGALFWGGLMTSRVKTLERAVEPIITLRTEMAALTERVGTLIRLLENGRGDRRPSEIRTPL